MLLTSLYTCYFPPLLIFKIDEGLWMDLVLEAFAFHKKY